MTRNSGKLRREQKSALPRRMGSIPEAGTAGATAASSRVISWADETEEEMQRHETDNSGARATEDSGPAQEERTSQRKRPGEEDGAEEEAKRRKREEERRSGMKRALEGMSAENEKRRREAAQETRESRGVDEMVSQLRRICEVKKDDIVSSKLGRIQACGVDEDHEPMERATDDVTGVVLDAAEVRRARLVEINYAKKKRVWSKIPRAVARRNGWKIVKTMWIDGNKGDVDHPNYRCRLVAKEFNDGEAAGLFAATPPLEALRLLLHDAATTGSGRERQVVMINDVSRAFFEAPMQRDMCIELPEEDLTEEDRLNDMVGYLNQSLYGTRDAASNFQKEVRKVMVDAGFTVGRYNPCMYYHSVKMLRVLVHGDDFVSTGGASEGRWFKKILENRFEIKTVVVGSSEGEESEARILNRIIRVTEHGWELEADQRHVDIIVEKLNLKEAKSVKTPAEDDKRWQEEEDAVPLREADSSGFRELAARANYLALDRLDIQYATKEVCRGMSAPTKGRLRRLRRLARYLIGTPRMIVYYRWQGPQEKARGFSDSDYAGCLKTAKSTSGGVLMIGQHYIKSWSSTQKTVALSTAEAELTALVKCSCELIGILQMAAEWNLPLQGELFADSSAALGVVGRKGAGKLRHVRVGQLWIQEKAESGALQFHKVRGDSNVADLLTKPLRESEIDKYIEVAGMYKASGRARLALNAADHVS
jgi:hypothetical protein